MSEKSSSSNSGIGIFGMTFIVFLVLKLIDVIDWSWWWVTAPLWGPVSLFLVGLGIFILIQILRK